MTIKTANQALEESKDIFEHVVVVGLKKDGKVDIVPTVATYQFCQWALDRAKFELAIMEKATVDAGQVLKPEEPAEASKNQEGPGAVLETAGDK